MARTVLITGGNSGIGAAMVRKFRSEGFTVWYTYLSGIESESSISSQAGTRAFPLDLGDRASIESLVKTLPSIPEIVIHNAGVGSATVKRVSDLAHQQDEALIKINAIGTLWLNDLLLPHFKKRDFGTIIFLSSVGGGITQVPGFRYADGMSKAAIAFLGRILAADLAKSGINVFTICPGATSTPMFEASTLAGLDQSSREELIGALPKGRMIEAEEIAALAHFLTTDAAKPLHGAVLDASMGLGVNPGLLQK
ncbi:MAG: SDR family oxidoreductase [Actinobacteria bacterium]|nr:SDR family oxidoreductase [Actinomycetota bacterium]